MPVPTRPGADDRTPPFPPPPEPPWPKPPLPPVPSPPQRTEPLHIPTVIQTERVCPKPEEHYGVASVEGLDPAAWEAVLRERFLAGYRLLQVVPGEGGRVLLVFEHRDA
jgi:hypothetical protein